MRIEAQRVGFLAVVCTGISVGILAARDPLITAAVGAGTALMTGALVAVLRLGLMPALIWCYFFGSAIQVMLSFS